MKFVISYHIVVNVKLKKISVKFLFFVISDVLSWH